MTRGSGEYCHLTYGVTGDSAQRSDPVGFDMHGYLLLSRERVSAASPGQAGFPQRPTAGNISLLLPDSLAHRGLFRSKSPSDTCSVSPKGSNRHTWRSLCWGCSARRKAEPGMLKTSPTQCQGPSRPTHTLDSKYRMAEAWSSPNTGEMSA